MWIVDLWHFDADEPVHVARTEAENKESAIDEARRALDLETDDPAGATVYDETSGSAPPTPVRYQVIVQD